VARFVILEHDHPYLHWDLMLQGAEALRTWRLSAPPRPRLPVAAEALGDHRLAYLDYEGPVKPDRGHVHRWDRGTLLWQTDEPRRVVVHLDGQRCRGTAELVHVDGNEWRLTLAATDEVTSPGTG